MPVTSLTQKFIDAANRSNGPLQTNVFMSEVRNFAEKFELFWNLAKTPAEKNIIGGIMLGKFVGMAVSIKAQPNIFSIKAEAEATAMLFNALCATAPELLRNSTAGATLRAEAVNLERAAALQQSDLVRTAFRNHSAMLRTMADIASPPGAAAAPRFRP